MLIAPKPKPADFTDEGVAADPFDVALVVVHGMGNAYKSQILLEWAEPLLERIDWLTRDRTVGASGTADFGVTVAGADLSGAPPIVSAEVVIPMPGPDGAVTRVVRRIAIVEARWSESFVPMTNRDVFRWALTFLWRAISRMVVQYGRTVVWTSARTLASRVRRAVLDRPARPHLLVPALLDLIRLAAGVIVIAALVVLVGTFGLVATFVMPLLSPLLLIPWFKKRAQAIIDGIVESIGDVATWKERPLRAAAMRLVVRDAVDRAARLVGIDPAVEAAIRTGAAVRLGPAPTGEVQVLAHSQGAAIAAFTLFSEHMWPQDYGVRRFTTVGAAVVLMGRERWKGRPDEYRPVQAWLERSPCIDWDNRWAIWDPFSAGPIADDVRSVRDRWREAYAPRRGRASGASTDAQGRAASHTPARAPTETLPGEPAYGPAEHAVHNTSNPFLDHAMYYENTLQVVEPAARNLLPTGFPAPRPAVAYVGERLVVIDKTSLGVNILLAIVIAGCVPGLPEVSQWLAEKWIAIGTWIASVAGVLLPFSTPSDLIPGVSQSFLLQPGASPPHLSDWGWAIASALLLALLVWLNQLLAARTTRCLVWNRCPPKPLIWLVVTSLPRLAYASAALLAVLLSVPGGEWWLVPVRIAVVVGVLLLFIEPFVAPVPVAVPSRTPTLPGCPGRGGDGVTQPEYTLKKAVGNADFTSEFRRRSDERVMARNEQDAADDLREAAAGVWWRFKRRIRRRLIRPVEDVFFVDRSSPVWKELKAGANAASAARPHAGRRH